MFNILSKNKTFVITVKNSVKAVIKVLYAYSYTVLLDLFTLFSVFCRRLWFSRSLSEFCHKYRIGKKTILKNTSIIRKEQFKYLS